MTPLRLFAILIIIACTAIAWFILAAALTGRTAESAAQAATSVKTGWGPPMEQKHPLAWYESPGTRDGRMLLRPSASRVRIRLAYEPRRKGLVWQRAYVAEFHGTYQFTNPAPIPQTVFVQFELPSPEAGYSEFHLTLDGKPTTATVNGRDPITEAVVLPAGATATLEVGYRTRGIDSWSYSFGSESRIRDFECAMVTDFAEVDFPTSSPTSRTITPEGWNLVWSYPDEIGARSIAMEMPKVMNPGPVAARIAFFAPVSLLFFFSVLILLCLIRGIDLHPMNFFFLAAGCFAFQLLFAYLVDLIPIGVAFALAATVSLALVSGYLWLARGRAFALLIALAQAACMVLFSATFFIDGLTGITITVGAILLLALLMVTTARIDWAKKFSRQQPSSPPPLP